MGIQVTCGQRGKSCSENRCYNWQNWKKHHESLRQCGSLTCGCVNYASYSHIIHSHFDHPFWIFFWFLKFKISFLLCLFIVYNSIWIQLTHFCSTEGNATVGSIIDSASIDEHSYLSYFYIPFLNILFDKYVILKISRNVKSQNIFFPQ